MNETLEDIIKWIRGSCDMYDGSFSTGDGDALADRIEAAYKFHLTNGSMCTMECVSLGNEINQYIEQIRTLSMCVREAVKESCKRCYNHKDGKCILQGDTCIVKKWRGALNKPMGV